MDAEATAALLCRVMPGACGVAALRLGRPVGYLIGIGARGVRGPGTAAYVPEWASAVDSSAPRELFTEMYAAASAHWVRLGWARHVVTTLALDSGLESELGWLGFAPCVVDAVRDLSIEMDSSAPDGITLKRVDRDDLEGLVELDRMLEDHLRGAPTFLCRDPEEEVAQVAGWLADSTKRVWLARSGTLPIAFVCLSSDADGVAHVVRDPRTVHVVAACTRPEFRSRGIAEAVLAAALRAARTEGYAAAAVDFETANPLARRFWLRFFTAACVSYERHIDPRVTTVTEAYR
jgi:ribosomal protein S18 acetylase RimI-like enzyme